MRKYYTFSGTRWRLIQNSLITVSKAFAELVHIRLLIIAHHDASARGAVPATAPARFPLSKGVHAQNHKAVPLRFLCLSARARARRSTLCSTVPHVGAMRSL